MDKTISIRCFAKINLALDVISYRDDGFHNIKSIFQSISLFDVISIKLTRKNIIILSSSKDIPINDQNIAYKAANKFFEYTGLESGTEIGIKKNIPVFAGLGGGSSNGAAVLFGLNKITGAGLSAGELLKIALQVGSDIPFFFTGGTALVEGRGEIVKSLTPIKKIFMILVKPDINISTAWAYGKINLKNSHPDIKPDNQYNIFESAVFPVYPEIKKIKEKLIKSGATSAMMSGSGSAVFGIFDNESAADKSKAGLNAYYQSVYKVYTVDHGLEEIKS